VERAHTNSLDANDKLIQTRSHVRDTIASRKRQFAMRKVQSTIVSNYSLPRATMLSTNNQFETKLCYTSLLEILCNTC